MGTSATVDADLCIGSVECNRIAGDAFKLDDVSGVSEPLAGGSRTDPAVLIEAAAACPTQAIRLRREDGSLLYGEP